MKKGFILTFLMGMLVLFTSCNGCKNTNQDEPVLADSIKPNIELADITHMISTDRQQMYAQVAEDYRWYETCVEFNNFLDEESDTTIHAVVNIFQAITNVDDHSADVTVYAFTHLADTMSVYPKQGFWVEDYPLNDEAIKLTWQDAYNRMMETNAPKPHSKQACLRKPVGPLYCNPQYVFGNIHTQLWVDAVTGEVKNSNPAFPDEDGFKMPLGEWP